MVEYRSRHDTAAEVAVAREWETSPRIFTFGKEDGLPSEIDIEVRVLDLEKDRSREAERRTAFVLGGVGEDTEIMKPFLTELAEQGIQVVGVSMPSHGKSGDVTRDWRVDAATGKDKMDFSDYSQLLYRLHETMQDPSADQQSHPVAGQIDLIGHSLGGAMAADLAMRHSEIIRSLHLIAPAGNKEEFTIPGVRIPPGTFWKFAKAHFGENVPTFVKTAMGSKEGVPIMRHLWLKNFFQTSAGVNQIRGIDESERRPRLVQRFWEGKVTAQGKLEAHLAAVQEQGIPVHVYVGENDTLFPSESYNNLRDMGIDVQVIPDTGHYGILQASRQYVDAIQDCLSE